MRKVRVHIDVSFKQGWATVGDKVYYWRAGFERQWAYYLEFLKEVGEIKDWEYEAETFWFTKIKRGTNNYRPDFKITYEDDSYCWHETKGKLTQKDVTKFRRMAKYHSEEKIILVMEREPTSRGQKLLLAKARQYSYGVIFARQLDYFRGKK